MFFLKTVSNSSVIIHPPGFHIIGFQTYSFINVYFIFLAFVYAVTVLSNLLVMSIIAFSHCLHTPKFAAVFNLAVNDLILNSCIIPAMIKIFLLKDNFIPFNACFVQMYVYYVSASLESFALAILAYDRLIAICFPLHQNSINTLRRMSCTIAMSWCIALGFIAFTTSIMTRLSFCSSVRVFSYFCDYAPVFRLACNDYTLQWAAVSFSSVLVLGGPFTFIMLTYVTILVTVFRMKSLESRLKALATCVEHIILVAVFYVPIFIIFTIGLFVGVIDPEQRVLSLSFSSCIPPCINPIVYSLKNEEIKMRALALVGKIRFRPMNHTNKKHKPWRLIV